MRALIADRVFQCRSGGHRPSVDGGHLLTFACRDVDIFFKTLTLPTLPEGHTVPHAVTWTTGAQLLLTEAHVLGDANKSLYHRTIP